MVEFREHAYSQQCSQRLRKVKKMDSLPSRKSFYQPSGFIPPARRCTPATVRALSRPRPTRKSYPTQAQAFAAAAALPGARVWGLEVDASGRRRFLVATTAALWAFYKRLMREARRAHVYEIIRVGPCRAYFDLEFRREGEGATADGDALTDDVVAAVRAVAEVWGAKDSGSVVRLLSSTPVKFSVHLIFPALVFSSAKGLRFFVEEVEGRLSPVARSLGLVDMGVYTPNRCFRLVGSSKFGKTQRLLPEKAYYATDGRVAFSEALFYDALVGVEGACDSFVDDGRPAVEGEILPLRAPAVAEAEAEVEASLDAGVVCRGGWDDGEAKRWTNWPEVDRYIEGLICGRGGRVARVRCFQERWLSYTIKGEWRFCARIGRHHKSNGIVLVVDVASGEVHQRCYDPDCRGFRSEAWALPLGVLERKAEAEGASDEELARFMEKWEEKDAKVAEVAWDEELARFMDDWESTNSAGRGEDDKGCVNSFAGVSDEALMEIELPCLL